MRGLPFRGSSCLTILLTGLIALVLALMTTLQAHATVRHVENHAASTYDDGRLQQPQPLASNKVVATTTDAVASIEFYEDASYRQRAWHVDAGTDLYVQVRAGACNRNPNAIDTVDVELHAWGSDVNDIETYAAQETGPNTGIFRFKPGAAPTDSLATTPALQKRLLVKSPNDGDKVLQAAPGNFVSATVKGCAGIDFPDVSTQIQVDPNGEVFDSTTGTLISGVTVTLIDVTGEGNGGHAGQPAVVFSYDGITPAPSRVVTKADGKYAFPLVKPSMYRLAVETPKAYTFPSKRALADLPQQFIVVKPGSFGGPFPVNLATGAVTLDVPLDAVPHGLAVQKTASRTTVEIAETVQYLVTVGNVGQLALDHVRVTDSLPAGFSYVPGSARLGNSKLADPAGGRGPQLTFDVGTVAAGASPVLSYAVRVGAGALQGDGVNRAQARSDAPAMTISNVATVQVKVQPGVFSDQAFVLGTVYADCNANGLQDTGEPGVPGVRLYMEDGSFVVTDAKGHYSFYGVTPRTHVLKVDAMSLPQGSELAAISQRHGGDGNSRFVDVHRGEMGRADFALRGCSDALAEALRLRRVAQGERELTSALKVELKPGAAAASTDVRALPAQGIVGATTNAAAPATAASAPAAAASVAEPVVAAPDTAPVKLETIASQADNQLDFIGLAEGQAVGRLPQTIRVKGRKGAVIALQVNGSAVGDDHVGERATVEDTQAELREYVGVTLKRGRNTLLLTEADGFGRVRTSRELHVVVAGDLAKVVVTPAATRADADGQSRTAVTIALQDAQGLAIADRTPVTLDATLGTWDARDLDDHAPGVQTFVEGGSATIGLIAPPAPGQADLRVSVGTVNGQAAIAYGPVLRPMMAVGIVEGAIDLRKLDPKALVPARGDDGFEQELRQFGSGSDTAGARAALFLKGKVRGDYLLTLGYDSAKQTNQGLFRDIQPDAFYPVYGDSSVRGYDAQSTGRLYVRIEKDKSYLLYGDYTTQVQNNARQLGAYQRSLSGVKEHYETDRVNANAWASRDTTRQTIVELHADGTSGPFLLPPAAIVANSEQVEVLVRDRNQPSLIVKSTPLTRFTDYDFDALTGSLLLRAPVASVDSNLNPMSIRVTYEVDQGGPAFWVAGADAQVQVTEQIEVGASIVRDYNPEAPFEMASVNATAKLTPETQLVGEVARAHGDQAPAGNAERVEFRHDGEALKARLYATRSDVGFDNPSSIVSSGRSEGGAKVAYALDERTQLKLDALHTGDTTSGAHRDGVLAGVERSFDGGTKVEVGVREVRASGSTDAQQNGETTSVRAKATTTVPGVPMASVYVEGEQDVRDSDKRLLAVGGDYQIANQGRVYLRHELISSLTGPYALDSTQKRSTTVVGVDADVMEGGRLFSEYRGLDAFDGRGTEAAIGLRNRWQLAEGLRANTSFERVQPISGANNDASAAVTGALEYTANPLWKGTARLELRDGSDSRSLLSTLGLARKIDDSWTFLGRNLYTLTQSKSASTAAPTRSQEWLQLGAAYRDSASNKVNALGRYEFKHERGGQDDQGGARTAHIVSTHADLQASRELLVSGHVAAKLVTESVNGQTIRSAAAMVGSRATYEIGERWDVGAAVSVLASGAGAASRQSAIGGEAGYMVQKNLWVSVGYNVTGFKDRDLSAENYTNRGVYLRLRFKFDENLFAGSSS